MVVALVVESGNSRQGRKTQQMSHSLPNSKHSQQETTHSTRPSWNQYVSSHPPNHVSPSALSCTHAAQFEIHQSKTMAVLCLSLTHRAHNQLDMLIEMHHCQCKCASLNSSNHGFTKRENSHLQCTPGFRPLLLALPLTLLELQLSCQFSLCFHLSRPYVSCTPYSPYADVCPGLFHS